MRFRRNRITTQWPMLRRIRHSILPRFIFFVLSFVFVAVLSAGLLFAVFSYREFRFSTTRDYHTILKSAANEIRLFMQGAHDTLESLAAHLTYTRPPAAAREKPDPDLWHKDIALTAFSQINTHFNDVALITADGRLVVGGTSIAASALLPQNPIFTKALNGETAISEVLYTSYNMPYVQLAVPIKRLGRVREVLWGELNLKSVWNVLEGIQIGHEGFVSVLNGDGRYISHRDMQPVLQGLSAVNLSAFEQIRHSDRVFDWKEKETQQLCMVTHIDDLDWYVLLRQPEAEIYAHLFQSLQWIVLLTAGICVVAGLLGWRWVHRLLQPIGELHAQVQHIGSGKLDQKVEIDSPDEIGSLASEFNRMAASLKELIDGKVEMVRKLEQAEHMAVMGEAAGKVTHEVKNLINNNNLVLDFIKKKPLDPESKRMIELLQGDMQQMKDFSDAFLRYSRKPHLRLIPVNPAPIVLDSLHGPKERARRMGVRLVCEWEKELPLVPLDPGGVGQIIGNLVNNSLDAFEEPLVNGAAPQHGPQWDQQTIKLNGKTAKGFFYLVVADNGPGIEAEILDQIFRPFFTQKAAKGTGLGLSIVKDIVEAHGGRIRCISSPDRGTAFQISFPLKPAAD